MSILQGNSWRRSRSEQPGQPSKGRRVALAMSGVAVVASAGVGAAMALPAAHAATTNHIYVHHHGLPTCTITFEWFDLQNKSAKTAHGTSSPCGGEAGWDPAHFSRVRVHINSGTRWYSRTFPSSSGAGHDHCILVKAFGAIVDTGDETQGCNSK